MLGSQLMCYSTATGSIRDMYNLGNFVDTKMCRVAEAFPAASHQLEPMKLAAALSIIQLRVSVRFCCK